MKQTLSIKLFSLLSIFLLMGGISLVFFNFYSSSKANIETLLKSNVQTNIFNLKHYLDSNLLENNINEIKAHLDTRAAINDVVDNIEIKDEHAGIIYSTKSDFKLSTAKKCIPIFEISNTNIFYNDCYSTKVKLYRGLKPYYYRVNVYLSRPYIDSLLHNQTIELIIEYFISLFLLLILAWTLVSKTIKTPLERLRQFAYYENEPPNEFFIQELESIRYSLKMTFKRLQKEQKELYKLSTRDELSGLYNKRSLIEKIEWLISEKKKKGETFAIILLDLDNFKTVNDSLGHNIGDKVLKEISQLLVSSVEKKDLVSRIGGDEFVIVLPEIDMDTRIIKVLDKIKTNIFAPNILESVKYRLTASMGVAIFPKDGKDVNILMRHADIAMYKSKELGKNDYHFYTENFNEDLQNKITMQNLLINALENDYFKLYYQAKVDIKTQKVSSCEALIRLIHPQKGLIPPNDFISIAEENNFIIELGYWVIKESVRQLKAWENTPLKNMKISINLSAKQFNDKKLVEKLQEYTKNIDRKKLDIELTESVFAENFDTQYTLINQIKSLGFSLSLDDFGTGYSSLSYLKNIPFDIIKIDKTFIDDLDTRNGQEFVSMIIHIAKMLKLHVVAEGVETEKQREYLDSIGCKFYQGYLFSRPLAAKQYELLLSDENSL